VSAHRISARIGRGVAGPHRQRGVAMMVAILLVAFGTILAASIAFESAMSARRSTATMAMDQSVLIAEAAEALAAYALREDAKAGKTVDHPAEEWSQPLGPVEVVPGIVLEAYVEDATGRFNLNSLIGADDKVDLVALGSSRTSWSTWASRRNGPRSSPTGSTPTRSRSTTAPKTAPMPPRIRPIAPPTPSSRAPRAARAA
jgi:hypothetical protein